MIDIPNTTLCCIDCIHYELSIQAIKRCCEKCKFDKLLFLTDKAFDFKEFDIIKIPHIISKEHYSKFLVKELNNYIETDFVLMIQYDGFIVNPDAWTSEFQKYDYIGAKWKYTDGLNVGNGGFSLRSKKLLEVLSDDMISIERDSLKNGEDHYICRIYRRFLESHYGINFASEDIADRFSYEYVNPINKTFGFHGLFNMWQYIKDDNLPDFVRQLCPKTLNTKEALFLGLNYHRLKKFKQATYVYHTILQSWPSNQGILILLEMANKEVVPDLKSI